MTTETHTSAAVSLPTALFDAVTGLLSGSEWLVLTYLHRHVHADCDIVTTEQMVEGRFADDGTRLDHGVGLTRSTTTQALRQLQAYGLIEQVAKTRSGPRWRLAGEPSQIDLGGLLMRRNLAAAKSARAATASNFSTQSDPTASRKWTQSTSSRKSTQSPTASNFSTQSNASNLSTQSPPTASISSMQSTALTHAGGRAGGRAPADPSLSPSSDRVYVKREDLERARAQSQASLEAAEEEALQRIFGARAAAAPAPQTSTTAKSKVPLDDYGEPVDVTFWPPAIRQGGEPHAERNKRWAERDMAEGEFLAGLSDKVRAEQRAQSPFHKLVKMACFFFKVKRADNTLTNEIKDLLEIFQPEEIEEAFRTMGKRGKSDLNYLKGILRREWGEPQSQKEKSEYEKGLESDRQKKLESDTVNEWIYGKYLPLIARPYAIDIPTRRAMVREQFERCLNYPVTPDMARSSDVRQRGIYRAVQDARQTWRLLREQPDFAPWLSGLADEFTLNDG